MIRPSSSASSMSAISSAVAIRVLLGTQSVMTAEPPRPSESTTVTSAPSCASFTRKVFDSINPTTGAQHLTRGIDQTLGAYSGGWTTVRPYSMSAAQAPGTSLAGVHRLYRSTNHDYLYTLVTAEITAAKRGGYVDQGVVFYAATSASTCTLPVWRFTSGSGVHRYVTSASDRS